MTDKSYRVPDRVAARVAQLGDHGKAWLAALPSIIDECTARWFLDVEDPFDPLWYNYVAKVTCKNEPAVLKVCCPGHEIEQEVAALQLFDGRMCVRLIAFDLELGALVLERAEPGLMIETMSDDSAEIAAAARLMRGLWRPVQPAHVFPLISDWLTAAQDRDHLTQVKRQDAWITRLLDRAAELTGDADRLRVLHGDLHHGNILSAQREPWLAIDPKGLVGYPEWEVGVFLFNSLKKEEPAERPRLVRMRADQFVHELSFDRHALYTWAAVAALHAQYWSLRDEPGSGRNWDAAMVCAEMLAEGI